MILTGSEIEKEVRRGSISIEPFRAEQLNPNSYNYRLGKTILVPVESGLGAYEYKEVAIPDKGYELTPGRAYLGHTAEILGSNEYAMSLIGRSSIGRLGLFLQVSANLGHIGSRHCWTLELVAAKRIIVYHGMKIGQISFWASTGSVDPYSAGYSKFDRPTCSKESAGLQ